MGSILIIVLCGQIHCMEIPIEYPEFSFDECVRYAPQAINEVELAPGERIIRGVCVVPGEPV